ncbi:hypothetical protein BDW02DRAFT_464628, partial [Decorospora gaudefroyi]
PDPPQPHFVLKETQDLDTSTFHKQAQTISDWLFLPHRSPRTLPSLHHYTLIYGLSTLRQRITDLVNLDLQLYHKYASLLSDEEAAEKAFAYTGWSWFPPRDATLEALSRCELEGLL